MSDGLAGWHRFIESRDSGVLMAALHPDAVFESPVVHTPQQGRGITAMYLMGAAQVLGNDTFRYVGEWRAERSAVLEFACEVDGLTVNGVDMIWWDEAGLITRFKVMVRPMKALLKVKERMMAMLEQLTPKS